MLVPVPNLFSFAPSELSQDAALAWLLAWADPRLGDLRDDELALHMVAGEFLRALLAKSEHLDIRTGRVESVSVERQAARVDVKAVVQIEGVGEVAVLIEDKVLAGPTGEQLPTYLKTAVGKYGLGKVVPIYLKTHDSADAASVEAKGWKMFGRAALLHVLTSEMAARVRNDIFVDFREHIERIELASAAFEGLELGDWTDAAWRGFYTALDRQLAERGSGIPTGSWGKVPNGAGGFWASWWPVAAVPGGSLYLQMEGRGARGSAVAHGKMTFRVHCSSPATDVRRAFRNDWHARVRRAAEGSNQTVERPEVFGNGATMAVAVLSGDVRGDVTEVAATVERAWHVAGRAAEIAVHDVPAP